MSATEFSQQQRRLESNPDYAGNDYPGDEPAAKFDFRRARRILDGLFTPRPWIYYVDLFVSVAIAYGAAIVFFSLSFSSPLKWLLLFVSGFALFRVGTFMHELQHLPGDTMRRFKIVWNILCGIPMLMPSFLYDNHRGHHRSTTYGTIEDGEYLPLGTGPWGHFAVYVIQALLLPLLVGFRFLVLVPISLVKPSWRRFVLERFSFYGINPHYRRPLPAGPLPRWWLWMDIACMIPMRAIPSCILAGLAPWMRIPELYLLACVSLGLNYVRNLAAHRYRNEGEPMTYTGQLLDSINITGRPIVTELLFPVGLRYHALHHLFPTLPYHNLGVAHERLMRELPADSPYRQTVYPCFLSVVRQLLRDAAEGRQRQANTAQS